MAMPAKTKGWNIYYTILVLWILVYSTLILNTPVNPQSAALYNISEQGLFIIRVTLAIPMFIIWFAGVFAFSALKRYVNLIRDTKEEPAFRDMLKGVGFIVWLGILSSIISTTSSYFAQGASDFSWRPITSTLSQYFFVIPYLIGFSYFLRSSMRFFNLHGKTLKFTKKFIIAASVFISLLGYIFLTLIFSHEASFQQVGDIRPTYYIGPAAATLTLIVPTFIAWFLGIASIQGFSRYVKEATGIIYKSMFNWISLGIVFLVFLSIFLEGLRSIGSAAILQLGLWQILALIYILIFIIAVAYISLAIGVRKLTKIESV
ncbi:MAG: hypothetical protein HYS87_00820 [Candidatus Colwellbacteria bacterium]|nr:hypothetical protein [Candidatus Colwellbacteria bacterium]